jgi:DNA modification methylase
MIIYGDCREKLKELEAESVQMCVTSPPYWGLRDYGHSGQLGLEETPELFVENLVKVFQEVKRVLRNDGTLWLNLGDSYSSGGRTTTTNQSLRGDGDYGVSRPKPSKGIKPKDLIGIPWRVAFALQADGWYLRQDIIWSKPNPMPESVTDRCTKSHEYIFLLSKSAKYFFNQLLEDLKPSTFNDRRLSTENFTEQRQDRNYPGNAQQGSGMLKPTNGQANKRSVWYIPTQPYHGAHFAVFPEKLIEPCILAGSKTGDVVLDPFFGSGTTGEVAERFGRDYIGIELNEGYKPLQQKRCAQMGLRI